MRGLVDYSLWHRSILYEICQRTPGFGGTLNQRGNLSLKCETTVACVSPFSSAIGIQNDQPVDNELRIYEVQIQQVNTQAKNRSRNHVLDTSQL